MEKKTTTGLSVNISLDNAKKLQALIDRAGTLAKQLQETLEQINNFELNITINDSNDVEKIANELYELQKQAISQTVVGQRPFAK